MRYHDFDLAIERDPDGSIALRAWCDEHGETRGNATLDAAALAQDRELLAEDEVARTKLVAIGSRLYDCTLASRQIAFHFGRCFGAADKDARGVRVRLRIAAPE